MPKKAKVSIIIPVYNSEPYLRQCLDSVVNQTLNDIEIIAINDGSSDSSLEILQNYAQKDSRFIVINQKNCGQSVCRNQGIKLATSPYICFVDSDDTIEKDMLKVLYHKAKSTQSDMVTCAYKIVSCDGTFSVGSRDLNNLYEISDPSLPNSVCGYLCHIELFTQHSICFPEGIYYEDQLTSIELMYYAKKIESVHTPFYNYFMREDSTTHTLTPKKIDDIFMVIHLIEKFLESRNILHKHSINITTKLLKLLNNYIFSYLLKINDDELAKHLYKNMQKSLHINKTELQKVSQNHFGIHFDFITKLFMLEAQYPFISILSLLLDPQVLSRMKEQKNKINSFSFTNLMLNYLLDNQISNVVLYGGGKIYQELYPLLQKHNIKILATIDTNKSLPNAITLEHFLRKKIQSPFLITSIAFAPEIEQILLSNIQNPCIISAKTLLTMQDI